MTPSSLLTVLAPAITEGEGRPLNPNPAGAPPAAPNSFSTVMSQVHRDVFRGQPRNDKAPASNPLPAETPAPPTQLPGKTIAINASAASTLIAVMAQSEIPAGPARKPASTRTVNPKSAPASQGGKAQSTAKTPDANATASETSQPVTVAPDEALLAVLTQWQIVPMELGKQFPIQPVNPKVAPDGGKQDAEPLKEAPASDALAKEMSTPVANQSGPAVDPDALLSNLLMSSPVLPQIAATKSVNPASAKSDNIKIAPESGVAPIVLPSSAETKPEKADGTPMPHQAASPSPVEGKFESKDPIAKTVDPRPMETTHLAKESAARSAEVAGSLPQPVAAQAATAQQIVSISAVSTDGTGGALSSQRMNSDGKKNEIAGRTEQNVPTEPQMNDFSAKTANTAVLGSDFDHSAHKQDSFDPASVVDWPTKSSESILDSGKGTGAAPPVDHSAAQAERVGHVVNQQVTMMRQSGANNLAVSLKVDPHTELNLQLTNHNGQIEASIRWERGATAGLDNHWKDLQESLSRVNVQLLPLENRISSRTSALNSVSDAAASSSFNQSSQNPQRQSRDTQQDLSLAGAAVAIPAAATNKTTSKTMTRTTTPQGWESWA